MGFPGGGTGSCACDLLWYFFLPVAILQWHQMYLFVCFIRMYLQYLCIMYLFILLCRSALCYHTKKAAQRVMVYFFGLLQAGPSQHTLMLRQPQNTAAESVTTDSVTALW